MGELFEFLKSAVKQLISNKTRTLMTMLGIIIGIASVVIVVTMGNGMTDFLVRELDSVMPNTGDISMNVNKTTERITREDLKEVKERVPDIYGITPVLSPEYESVKIKTKRGSYLAAIVGRSEGGLYAQGPVMAAGSYFTEQQVDNAARICVINDTDADKIFGTRNCIGMDIEITIGAKSATYTVVGLRQNTASVVFSMFDDPGDEYMASVEVPYTSYCADYNVNADALTRVSVYAHPERLSELSEQARNVIAQNHMIRDKELIPLRVYEGLSDVFGSVMNSARVFMILIAIISLVVGGIGVMNIMLVSVTERTREIGIRKSIGARTGAVMIQFLAESAFLTLLGGILGIGVGLALAKIGCNFLGFKFIISPMEILMAALFSVIIGVFFGLYPAAKASGMKPIDALRNLMSDVKNTRVRGGLTILGIVIGITAVLVVLIVSDGYEAQMKADLNKRAAGIILKVDQTKTDKFITRDVLKALEDLYAGDIYGIDMLEAVGGPAMTVNKRGKDVTADLFGDGEALGYENAMKLIVGRYYSFEDIYECNRVCVIPEVTAKDIFGYTNVVGKELPITIGQKSYNLTVVGVTESTAWDLDNAATDCYFVYLPFTTASEFLGKNPDQVVASCKLVLGHDSVDDALKRLSSIAENLLEVRGKGAITITREDTMSGFDKIIKAIKYVGSVIAAISIVVGGIGVMNIMTVTVTERTREIGIRKSIGARTGYIMLQFLGDASRLTFIGGLIGVALGLGLSYVACMLVGFPFVVDPVMVVLVSGASVVLGIFFGINPAYKAAKLKPIDALRTD